MNSTKIMFTKTSLEKLNLRVDFLILFLKHVFIVLNYEISTRLFLHKIKCITTDYI